ncbi:hypothetical protein C8R43DRAFT_1199222 [Mycena crocata]|nr:hypothetical protein C8R43DRAFT_1199222 [Mycena crocata]
MSASLVLVSVVPRIPRSSLIRIVSSASLTSSSTSCLRSLRQRARTRLPAPIYASCRQTQAVPATRSLPFISHANASPPQPTAKCTAHSQHPGSKVLNTMTDTDARSREPHAPSPNLTREQTSRSDASRKLRNDGAFCVCGCRDDTEATHPQHLNSAGFERKAVTRAIVICLHAAVAQESYGSEKRFLCPPHLVHIEGPVWQMRHGQEGKVGRVNGGSDDMDGEAVQNALDVDDDFDQYISTLEDNIAERDCLLSAIRSELARRNLRTSLCGKKSRRRNEIQRRRRHDPFCEPEILEVRTNPGIAGVDLPTDESISAWFRQELSMTVVSEIGERSFEQKAPWTTLFHVTGTAKAMSF